MAIKLQSEFGEDLLTLARENYRTASELCGACKSYHSVWPYLRIADAVFDIGVQQHFPTVLAEIAGTGRARKWLVAGSAGTGLCAAVWQSLQNAGVTAPELTIADRCATPLQACQRFALANRFSIETWHSDLLNLEAPNDFDAVVTHGLLPFFDADQQRLLFKNLSRCLRPGGILIVHSRYYVSNQGDGDHLSNSSDRAATIMDALIEGGVDLPDTRQSFEQKLQDYTSTSGRRSSNLKRPDELAPLLEEADFRVLENRDAFIDAAGKPRGYDRTTCYFVTVAEKKS